MHHAERRRVSRFEVSIPVTLTTPSNPCLVAKAEAHNISAQGAYVAASLAYEVGTTLTLKVFPREGINAMDIPAVVVRRETLSDEQFGYGLRFVLSERQSQGIKRTLRAMRDRYPTKEFIW